MSAKWTKLEGAAKHALLHGGRVVTGPHSFSKMVLSWPYCSHCGLVLLKNDLTRRAAKKLCERLED